MNTSSVRIVLRKSVAETLDRHAALSLEIERAIPQRAYAFGPDDVRIELIEDAGLTVPVQMHHMHLFVPDTLEAQAWYGRRFGATPATRGPFDIANLPGRELTFSAATQALAPTEGRALDHIRFEVTDLNAFVQRLRNLGLTEIDGPRLGGNGTTKISYVTDPWGTRIEITEGLEPAL
jgi:catechol 2,3-dioxygenase-like lactoylglutathione lyase family enzyme